LEIEEERDYIIIPRSLDIGEEGDYNYTEIIGDRGRGRL